jgi:hypothetical protein
MTRLELCQLAVQVILRTGLAGDDNDLPGLINFHARDRNARSGDGLDGPRHVMLPEC